MASIRFFSRLSRVKSKKSIDIQNVRKDKFIEAVGFMRNNFIDDPLMRSMGITDRNRETQKFLSALWLTLLRSELSLAAVYRSKICGLCVNCPMTTTGGRHSTHDETLLRLSEAVKTAPTRNLLQAWHKIDREAPLPGGNKHDGRPKRVMELAGLAVDYRHRYKGIAKKMVQSTADLAMLLGFDYLRVDCTNPATAKICDRLGWTKVWEMPFEKFEGVSIDTFPMDEYRDYKVKVYIEPVQRGIHKKEP